MADTKVPNAPLDVLKQFRVVFRAAQQHSADIEKLLGISGAQAWLLVELRDNGPLKAGELAARMSIKPATLSNMLLRLEELGYLLRQRNARDMRIVEVVLSDTGRELISKADYAPRGWLPEALSRLSSQQLDELSTALCSLLSVMQVDTQTAANSPLPFTE
ncbi:MarR family winged helix-turn-helix transcriptional regulator [Vogesella facilis]|uniref:MarR family winged helix-turn-helix transcriptional regulator n=1 Tax=Vogesella facilis TaxID=1655232 RepID=A0ABV7RD13_9NEIS